MARAIWAIRCLAPGHPDESQVTGWFSVALAYVGRCSAYDREQLLTAWWPDELRVHPVWTKTALATAASPELIDYYNQRREPLLQALMDRPQLLADMPLSEIEPLSSIHGAAHPWRALEPVELLQSAGRWADAVVVARSVEDRQPPGEEGARGRRLAGTIARGAELAQALADGAAFCRRADWLTDAVTVCGRGSRGVHPRWRAGRPAPLHARRPAGVGSRARLLLASPVSDPARAADGLDQAAGLLLGAPSVHASGAQRGWIARAWQIAALLLRYDAEHPSRQR